jgi:hypothetical protein
MEYMGREPGVEYAWGQLLHTKPAIVSLVALLHYFFLINKLRYHRFDKALISTKHLGFKFCCEDVVFCLFFFFPLPPSLLLCFVPLSLSYPLWNVL